jgi:hypothetical protein
MFDFEMVTVPTLTTLTTGNPFNMAACGCDDVDCLYVASSNYWGKNLYDVSKQIMFKYLNVYVRFKIKFKKNSERCCLGSTLADDRR